MSGAWYLHTGLGCSREKAECHGSASLAWPGVVSGVLGWVSLRGDVFLGERWRAGCRTPQAFTPT